MRYSVLIVPAVIVLSVHPPTFEVPAAADPTPPSQPAASANAARVLQGQLMKIEGEYYVVKEASGKEVRVHVGQDTALDGRIKVGDRIDAQVSANGHAVTVLKALE